MLFKKCVVILHQMLAYKQHKYSTEVAVNVYNVLHSHYFKGTPVVLFISLDSFGVSCLVLEISAVEIYAFFLI